MGVHRWLIAGLATMLLAGGSMVAGPGGAVWAQAPTAAPSPTPMPIQAWGLPPLPAGVGPVDKFADVSGTPQGKFLEGGAFDTQGNLWFVAIGSGWISYLTPDASWCRWLTATRRPDSVKPANRRGAAGTTASSI